ncbi:MAG: tRNA (adenosine(37)-N6)-threonylcarbamoyltransferase complex ATPase subunit type 1 TsaE [Sedimentisphaerales bacterium]|nr:tRNA (adenosine(37)-N6)-threonylcarbamoyltransferase complex ATPase subunit type 1 TsaE [Sedimentisphaerales bacterium]
MKSFDLVSTSPEQTIEIGRELGKQFKGAEIIGIYGPLGSGKTHLIKGIAAGAGAKSAAIVNSPTFVIINEYKGKFDIYHIDAYRLNTTDEFEALGFDDYCYPHSVVLIEWADKIDSALQSVDYIRIELSHAGQNLRKIHIANLPLHIKCRHLIG